jgi:hypothetical protein
VYNPVNFVRLQVLTAASMSLESSACDVAPCSQVDIHVDVDLNINLTTRCYIPEDSKTSSYDFCSEDKPV